MADISNNINFNLNNDIKLGNLANNSEEKLKQAQQNQGSENTVVLSLKNDNLDFSKPKKQELPLITLFSNDPLKFGDTKYKQHYEAEKPIPNMIVKVKGKDFDEIMNNEELTPYKIAQEVNSNEMIVNNPDLEQKIIDFCKNLDSKDKEALMYMKALINRNPSLSVEDFKSVFTKLDSMMKETNYDSRIVDKKEMVISALHDIAAPSDISQEGIGTCTGTTIQIQLAIRNPKEYLNMIDNLAKNKPHITMSGKKIDPNWTFTEEGKEGKTDTRRTISSKIMQNAIMDFADANTRNFDSSKADGGLSYEQTSEAIKDITKQNVTTYEIWDYSPKQLVDLLKKSNPSLDNPIEASMSYQADGRDSFHSINVVDILENKINIINPWGRDESFNLEDFQSRVMSISGLKDLDIGTKKINQTDYYMVKNITDNSKRDSLLNSMKNIDKVYFIRELSDLYFFNEKPSDKKLSDSEKKAIQHVLNNLLDTGVAQRERIHQVIIANVGVQNTALLLNRINDNSELYNSIKTKMDELSIQNNKKASQSSNT
ncbi:MAG: hypothetical protein U0457_04460 [Candidatus Sericytochromatia bacterium]